MIIKTRSPTRDKRRRGTNIGTDAEQDAALFREIAKLFRTARYFDDWNVYSKLKRGDHPKLSAALSLIERFDWQELGLQLAIGQWLASIAGREIDGMWIEAMRGADKGWFRFRPEVSVPRAQLVTEVVV